MCGYIQGALPVVHAQPPSPLASVKGPMVGCSRQALPERSGCLFLKLCLHKLLLPFIISNQDLFSLLSVSTMHTHIRCWRTNQRFVFLFIFISNEASSNQTAKTEKIITQLEEGFLPLFLVFSFVDHFQLSSSSRGNYKSASLPPKGGQAIAPGSGKIAKALKPALPW